MPAGQGGPIRIFRHAGAPPPPAAAPVAESHAIFGASWLRIGFVIMGHWLASGARIALNGGGDPNALGSFDPVNTVMQLAILLGSTALVLRNLRRCLALLRPAWPFLLMLSVLLASVTWSQSPMHSLRRCVSMTGLLLFLLSTYADFGPRRSMRIILLTILGIAALSLAEAVLRPSVGYDVGEYANAIRGVFQQKNALGMAMLAGALALSFIVLERGFVRLRDLGILLGLVAMLVLCRSTTSLLLTLFTASCTGVILGLHKGRAWMATTLLGLGVGASVGLLFFAAVGVEGLFDIIGKDSSLTGRVYIWAAVREVISTHPLLGHGYFAFWIIGSRGMQRVWDLVEWEPPTAHSGYLEVLLQLGALGAALGAVMLAVTLFRAIRGLFGGNARRASWILMFLVILSILSYSESALFNPDLQTVFWMLGTMALMEGGRGPAGPDVVPRAPGMLFRTRVLRGQPLRHFG
jgi:O-antigen ligase